jgi:REP element-mobilizing transposase RayT
MSRVLRNDVLKELGEIHFGRRRLQPRAFELREFIEGGKTLLQHPILELGPAEVAAISYAFEQVVKQKGYTCYACVIMPDHIHILIRKHREKAEEMIAALQRESHLRLREIGLRDMEHPVWGGKGWKVFLEDAGDISRTVKYIEDNPIKIRQPRQVWGFVTRYDGWTGSQVRIVRSKRDQSERS